MAYDLTFYPDGDPMEIEAEGAHQLEQSFGGLLDWYLVVLGDTEHADIESRKSELKSTIQNLVSTLNDAHWADHNLQQDEDHDISDEEWAKIEARCAEAKIEASSRVSAVSTAYRALTNAQEAWVQSLRAQIAKLDRQIVFA